MTEMRWTATESKPGTEKNPMSKMLEDKFTPTHVVRLTNGEMHLVMREKMGAFGITDLLSIDDWLTCQRCTDQSWSLDTDGRVCRGGVRIDGALLEEIQP